jgi:hypothetical protein
MTAQHVECMHDHPVLPRPKPVGASHRAMCASCAWATPTHLRTPTPQHVPLCSGTPSDCVCIVCALHNCVRTVCGLHDCVRDLCAPAVCRLGSFARLRERMDDARMSRPVLVGAVRLGLTTALLLNFTGGVWCVGGTHAQLVYSACTSLCV